MKRWVITLGLALSLVIILLTRNRHERQITSDGRQSDYPQIIDQRESYRGYPRAAVLRLFGEPDERDTFGETEIWTYGPDFPGALQAGKGDVIGVRFFFDTNGLVTDCVPILRDG